LNVRATLLTWLQETRVPAFVVATANRFNALPPELTRAGRFDARFFLGCPDADGRKQILNIHLNARGIGMDVDDLKPVIDLTQGFTGAELEQIVLDALYAAFNRDEKMTLNDLVAAASQSTPLIRAVGKGLDEVWNLIEQGRVLPASDSLLSRTQLAKLIDPDLFSPMYCRQENISGWDRQASKGARMLMRDPLQGSSAAILETGDDEWAFVQTNVRFEPADQHHWKFLDKISTIAANGVLDTLVTQYGVEAILFENRERMRQFAEDSVLGAYAELYRPAALDEASEMSD
jgi:SpoVK/Ycf46/Vps4 family AAA+-type ATPase